MRLDLGPLGLRRTASSWPLRGDTDSFSTIGEGMIAPRLGRAAPPSLPTPCIGDHGLLRVGSPGQPPRCNVLDVLCDTLGFLGLGGGRCPCCLVGHRARGDDQQA